MSGRAAVGLVLGAIAALGLLASSPAAAATTTPTIWIDDVAALEGDAGQTAFDFTISLSEPWNGKASLRVGFTTADQTATSPSDYAHAEGEVYFGIGQSEKTVTIEVNGDAEVEPDEHFSVVITNRSGCGRCGAVATILDDDLDLPPPPAPPASVPPSVPPAPVPSPPAPPSPAPSPGVAPVAQIVSAEHSPTIARAVWFSASRSSAAPGRHIVRYEWDFDSDGSIDLVSGPDVAAASTTLRKPGRYTATLRVVDSAGQTAIDKQAFTISRQDAVRTNAGLVTLGERPSEGNQRDRPGCVKTFAFSIAEVNGRGGPGQCFAVTTSYEVVRVQVDGLSVPFPIPRYHATIRGPVALNGLVVPVPVGFESEYDTARSTVELGRRSVELKLPGVGRKLRLADVDLDLKLPRYGRYALPPLRLSRAAKFFGLRMGGAVDVVLERRASGRRSDVSVWLDLPNFLADVNGNPIQGKLALRASNGDGVTLAKGELDVPRAYLGPLLVDGLVFRLNGDGYTMEGGANLAFPGGLVIRAAPPPAGQDGEGFGLANGRFWYAGLGITFPPPGPQLFPGIGLQSIDGSFGLGPTRIRGGLGINLGGVAVIDGNMLLALASGRHPYTLAPGSAPPGLGFIEGTRLTSFAIAVGGQASLLVPVIGKVPLADAHVFYRYPGFAELGGRFGYGIGDVDDPEPLAFGLNGGLNGWIAFDRPVRFNLGGGLNACLGIEMPLLVPDVKLCRGVEALVSSRGFHACLRNLTIPIPPFFIPTVGVGYRWGGGLGATFFSCDATPYREARPQGGARASGAGLAASFEVSPRQPSAQLRVLGHGGPPAVTIEGPGGRQIVLAAAGEEPAPATGGKDYFAVRSEGSRLDVSLRKPAAGAWTVTARPGSPPIGVAVARGLPQPRVGARVTGKGRRRVLHYRLRPAAGQRVRFVEQGERTYRVLGSAQGRAGSIRFRPGDGSRGRRRIVALVERNGLTSARLTVARYAAPATGAPPPPRRLRVRRQGSSLKLSWRRAKGVRRYAVTVRISNGRRIFRLLERRGGLAVKGIQPGARGAVLVQGVRADGLAGRAAKVPIPRPHRPRHHHRRS